jgi:hypothetical protein
MRINHAMCMTILLVLIATMIGCEEDEQLARMAQEHARRQAAQSQQMAQLQQEVAQGTRELVEANDRAQQAVGSLHRDIQTERSEVGRQRDLLEEDRKQIAEQRHRDPIIAATIMQVGMVVACVLPLILCWYLLHREPAQADDAAVAEVLFEDLTAETPLLLPSPTMHRPAIEREDSMSDSEFCDADQTVG